LRWWEAGALAGLSSLGSVFLAGFRLQFAAFVLKPVRATSTGMTHAFKLLDSTTNWDFQPRP